MSMDKKDLIKKLKKEFNITKDSQIKLSFNKKDNSITVKINGVQTQQDLSSLLFRILMKS